MLQIQKGHLKRVFIPIIEAHLCQGQAGEEWLFEGPATYIPQVEVEVVENIQAYVLAPNQALRVTSFLVCILIELVKSQKRM
jgi:hypothetical protein